MGVGTKKVVHISFVVKDIQKVMENWAKLLDVDVPKIWKIPGPDVAPVLTEGEPQVYQDCWISVLELDNVTLEVCQPGNEPSPWKTFLEKHGEGMMHLAFLTPDEKKAEQTIEEIGGPNHCYHIGYYPEQSYAFYDTWDALKTELNLKVNRDNSEIMEEIRKRIADKA